GYTAGDHVQAIYDHIGNRNLDSIIVHNQPINQSIKQRYADEDAEPVNYDLEKLKELDLKIIERDLIEPNQHMLRHDKKKIAYIIYEMALDTQATREKESNELSFASEIKKELTNIKSDKCCIKAESAALIRMKSKSSIRKNTLTFDIQTENVAIA